MNQLVNSMKRIITLCLAFLPLFAAAQSLNPTLDAGNLTSVVERVMQKRDSAMYENGEVSYLKLLLNSNGIVDFLKRYELVNSMIEADQALISELTELSKQIEIEKQELELASTLINQWN